MHRIFYHLDVLHIVFSILDQEADYDLAVFVSLSTVNRVFSAFALSIIWRTIDDVQPLINIILPYGKYNIVSLVTAASLRVLISLRISLLLMTVYEVASLPTEPLCGPFYLTSQMLPER